MKKRLCSVKRNAGIALISVMLFTTPGFALSDELDSNRAKIESLFEISNFKNALEKLPTQVVPMYKQSLDRSELWDKNDPSQVALIDVMKEELSSTFTAPALYLSAINHYEDSVSTQHLNQQLDFFKSLVGRAVSNQGFKVSGMFQSKEFKKFSASFPSDLIDKQRLVLVTEVVDAVKAHTLLVDMIISMEISSLMGMADSMPESIANELYKDDTVLNLMAHYDEIREPLTMHMRQQLIAAEYYTYRYMSTSGLKEYKEFIVSKAGLAMNDTVLDAYNEFSKKTFYAVGVAAGNEITNTMGTYAEAQ